MNIGSLILWGFVGTVALTTLEACARGLGLTRMGIPFMLGTMFTGHRDRANVIGFLAHFVNGWLIAFVYAAVFDAIGRATWWLGAGLGLCHALFILAVVLPLMPSIHPRMADEDQGPGPTRMLQPAGFFALHYGRRSAIVVLVTHCVYGVILGATYGLRGPA